MMRESWRPFFTWNLNTTSLLPSNWQSQIDDVVERFGYETVLTGQGSTSREKRSNQYIKVVIVDGLIIRPFLPWLWSIYNGPLLDFASSSFGRPLFPAEDEKSAVNINNLTGNGARYEWHVDSNPVTGLLFASTCPPEQGGGLVFRDIEGKRNAIVRPTAGVFICFDAREIPHRVAPLKGDISRTSIPMNYYETADSQARPSDLEAQIYSTSNP